MADYYIRTGTLSVHVTAAVVKNTSEKMRIERLGQGEYQKSEWIVVLDDTDDPG